MKVYFAHKDETHVHIKTDDPDFLKELQGTFKFEIPNRRFNPKVKAGQWDGYIRMVGQYGYAKKGLLDEYVKLATYRNATIGFDKEIIAKDSVVTFDEAGLQLKFPLYDYQVEGITKALKSRRRLIISPTSSGKSAIAGCLMRSCNTKTLFIVPNISLLAQIESDLSDLFPGWDVRANCTFIGDGAKGDDSKKFVISTWQSLQNHPEEWFTQFRCVIVDEAHQATANVLTKIVDSCVNAIYRFGMTGTLDGSKTNEMALRGLFGPIYRTTTTKAMIEAGRAAPAVVKAIVLKYHNEVARTVRKLPYDDEMDVIHSLKVRNEFLGKFSTEIDGNTLWLFKEIAGHGEILLETIQRHNPDKKVIILDKDTKKSVREEIRKEAETRSDMIILATYALFSTGVSIKNLYNVVFAAPIKGRIKVLQSIGRSIRLHSSDKIAKIYDVVDDFRGKTKTENWAIKHFQQRLVAYQSDQFPIEIKEYTL